MAELILHGSPRSNYVRTCRIVLAEKGVTYSYDPVMPQTPEQRARHPWGKVPAMTHGDLALYETLAITRYIDDVFDGPGLQPSTAAGRGLMDQWISVYNAYLNITLATHVAIERMLRNPPKEDIIAAALPEAARCLGVVEDGLADTPYLAGEGVSLADFFLLPTLDYLSRTPEAEELLAQTGNINGWLARMMAMDSAQAVLQA
jgi:glutathione S-transferase